LNITVIIKFEISHFNVKSEQNSVSIQITIFQSSKLLRITSAQNPSNPHPRGRMELIKIENVKGAGGGLRVR
jgi:glycine cleavage system H lipoate-binding protein